MKKGIFWVFITVNDDCEEIPEIESVSVGCDLNGNALEEADYTSKSGDNFNHKMEWEKNNGFSRYGRNKSIDYFPRGRVEIKKGKIRVFAHPCLIEEEKVRDLIIDSFELGDIKDKIYWLPDNSIHYQSKFYSSSNDLIDNDIRFPHIDFSKIKIDAVIFVDDVRKYSNEDIRRMHDEIKKNEENKENR